MSDDVITKAKECGGIVFTKQAIPKDTYVTLR
jgi:hypothetical protein